MVSLTGIPLVHGEVLTSPPTDLISEYESNHFGDKTFKGLMHELHIRGWLKSYNRTCTRFQLHDMRALPNWFFIIRIISLRGDTSTQAILVNLLQAPTLQAEDVFAITHLYSPSFDPTCPIPLR